MNKAQTEGNAGSCTSAAKKKKKLSAVLPFLLLISLNISQHYHQEVNICPNKKPMVNGEVMCFLKAQDFAFRKVDALAE